MTTEELLMGLAVIRELTGTQKNDLESTVDAVRAAFAPADSVTAPAGAGVAHALSDARIEAMPVWRNFVGLWPESRREIVDAVVDLLTTPPAQAADSVLEDAARWRELRAQDDALILQLVEALEYHRAQTRPIDRTDEAITAGRARLGRPHD